MNQALTYIYYIFNKFYQFVFNDMLLFDGVSFGYICVSFIIIGVLINSIMNLPKGMKGDNKSGESKN